MPPPQAWSHPQLLVPWGLVCEDQCQICCENLPQRRLILPTLLDVQLVRVCHVRNINAELSILMLSCPH